MREAHITRRGTSFYLLIFIEKIINRKIEHSLYKRLHHGMWLFHPHSAVKMQPFYPVFPVANPQLTYFAGYSFETARKKTSTIFYAIAFLFPTERTPATQPPRQPKFLRVEPGRGLFIKGSIMACGCFIPTVL